MEITSSAFTNNGNIPAKYCNTGVDGGENISIPVQWANPPEGTKSFLLVIVDTHQVANNWLHWVVKDIPADANEIPEGASGTQLLPPGSIELTGTGGLNKYEGPQPPTGTGNHPYEIHLFALSTEKVEFSNNITWETIKQEVSNKTISEAILTGVFGR